MPRVLSDKQQERVLLGSGNELHQTESTVRESDGTLHKSDNTLHERCSRFEWHCKEWGKVDTLRKSPPWIMKSLMMRWKGTPL